MPRERIVITEIADGLELVALEPGTELVPYRPTPFEIETTVEGAGIGARRGECERANEAA